MKQRTKIVATLGPASTQESVLQGLIEHGVSIFRVNMSHGTQEEHAQTIDKIRALSKKMNIPVGILCDLQGPKIRISKFEKPITLENGDLFVLDANVKVLGDKTRVGLDYPDLIKEVVSGDTLLLNDGAISLEVLSVDKAIHTRVIHGGDLSDHKGINKKGGGLSAPALTEKDFADLAFAVNKAVDYIALSFVKSPIDVYQARDKIYSMGAFTRIISKIECTQALENLAEIIDASDGIMVARGDLGVELGYAELPHWQKQIIKMAVNRDKPVITATQMMESMITSSMPTRAEVTDVANSIIDGTDAVMLSAETAVGKHPVLVVNAMSDICISAERQTQTKALNPNKMHASRVDEAIAMAAIYLSNISDVHAIIALSESGSTPLWMSRFQSHIPIYGLSRHEKSCALMTLYKGVYPLQFDATQFKKWEVSFHAIQFLVKKGLLKLGDKVLVTKGDVIGEGGLTNGLKIITVAKEHE